MPPSNYNLLIVDDDETIQRLLCMAAKDRGWRPVSAGSGLDAVALMTPEIEAVILDIRLPGMDGITTIGHLHEKSPDVPIIMLTGTNDAETAVQALKAGATDYLTKPFALDRLFKLLRPANKTDAEGEFVTPPRPHRKKPDLITSSPRMKLLYRQMEKAAVLNSTILLTGESGTGKTSIARQIHLLSPRASEQFITVSCPALTPELLEAELFGQEKVAFPTAKESSVGSFELASDGTIFLDEIGDLSKKLQPKLLNVLQDHELFKVGGNQLIKTNARVIAATNVDLKSRVESGKFREDLFYRLNIIELNVPPLRERKEDIPQLVEDILVKISESRNVQKWSISAPAANSLLEYNWPGNVRQLENVLERVTAFSNGVTIEAEDIIGIVESPGSTPRLGQSLSESGLTLHEIEREAFIQTYIRTGKNKAKTARELGISERSVYNLMGRHGLK